MSSRTSYPSEWYGAFARQKRWVILHLNDGRRVYGWPEEWPDQSDKGHFVLDEPEWLLDTNKRAPMFRVKRFMLPAPEVKMVEFLKENEEVEQASAPTEVQEATQLLLEAQKQETPDGCESSATGPESTDAGSPGEWIRSSIQRPSVDQDGLQTDPLSTTTPAEKVVPDWNADHVV